MISLSEATLGTAVMSTVLATNEVWVGTIASAAMVDGTLYVTMALGSMHAKSHVRACDLMPATEEALALACLAGYRIVDWRK